MAISVTSSHPLEGSGTLHLRIASGVDLEASRLYPGIKLSLKTKAAVDVQPPMKSPPSPSGPAAVSGNSTSSNRLPDGWEEARDPQGRVYFIGT